MPGSNPREALDPVEVATKLPLDEFIAAYLPPSSEWTTYTHTLTSTRYNLSLIPAPILPSADHEACFSLISDSSRSDYSHSILGWQPRAKRQEMKLLDLKYLLIRRGAALDGTDGHVEGFVSFMPTYEDGLKVLYIYEIHLAPALRGSGMGSWLINLVLEIAERMVGIEKVMLTVFMRNRAARRFYARLVFEEIEVVANRRLRGKTDGEDESGYVIMGKDISSSNSER